MSNYKSAIAEIAAISEFCQSGKFKYREYDGTLKFTLTSSAMHSFFKFKHDGRTYPSYKLAVEDGKLVVYGVSATETVQLENIQFGFEITRDTSAFILSHGPKTTSLIDTVVSKITNPVLPHGVLPQRVKFFADIANDDGYWRHYYSPADYFPGKVPPCTYEVLCFTPINFYLDLDYVSDHRALETIQEIIGHIKRYWTAKFQEELTNDNIKLTMANKTSGSKSFHLIVYGKRVFSSVTAVSYICKELFDEFKSYGNIIDRSVYKMFQRFRLPNSDKTRDDARPLVPVDPMTLEPIENPDVASYLVQRYGTEFYGNQQPSIKRDILSLNDPAFVDMQPVNDEEWNKFAAEAHNKVEFLIVENTANPNRLWQIIFSTLMRVEASERSYDLACHLREMFEEKIDVSAVGIIEPERRRHQSGYKSNITNWSDAIPPFKVRQITPAEALNIFQQMNLRHVSADATSQSVVVPLSTAKYIRTQYTTSQTTTMNCSNVILRKLNGIITFQVYMRPQFVDFDFELTQTSASTLTMSPIYTIKCKNINQIGLLGEIKDNQLKCRIIHGDEMDVITVDNVGDLTVTSRIAE